MNESQGFLVFGECRVIDWIEENSRMSFYYMASERGLLKAELRYEGLSQAALS